MFCKKIALASLGLMLLSSLLACNANLPLAPSHVGPTPDLRQIYADLAKTGGKLYALDAAKSDIRIYVFSGGRAPGLGHNHVLSSHHFSGFFYLPNSSKVSKANDIELANARFDLLFRLDQLAIDTPEDRVGLGSAFAAELSVDSIASTREHMLGADNLQAEQFPLVRIRSVQLSGVVPKIAALVAIELHGQERTIWLPLKVEGLPEQLGVSGALVLRQSDFGIQPYSALGGLLAVQDEIVIEFRLTGN